MKDEFLRIYQENIKRPGAEEFLKWLESTDFFSAPASTRFHLAQPGGLVEHSVHVYERLKALCELRNRKNDKGQWEQYPFYIVNDQLPYGHGEKSVYIINGFMKLTREEAMAIRWHMGGFDESVKGGSHAMSDAFSQFPLAVLLHVADLQATYLDESDGET